MEPPPELELMDVDWIPQAAAIPIRNGQICLVTSRSGRRWVVPKGGIDAGHSADQTALIEAWEEAGLRGQLNGGPVGTFTYSKFEKHYRVTVFQMDVTEEAANWPEKLQREKVWLAPEEAAEKVDDPGLKTMLLALAEQVHATI